MKAILKINDKEIEVEMSEEQIEKLTEKKKNPFNFQEDDEYFYISHVGFVTAAFTSAFSSEINMLAKERHSVANYCTDKDLIQQQAYRETLNRLLWRWQCEHDEPCDWGNPDTKKFKIIYDYYYFAISFHYTHKQQGAVYFTTKEKAEQAIEEVVKPFMAEHPDFVW